MNAQYSIIKSKTFWVFAFLMAYNDLMLVQPVLHGKAAVAVTLGINFLGLVLGTLFHVNPSQKYNLPSDYQ